MVREMRTKVKTADIISAMALRWTSPEWAVMWEVANGTGSAGGRRRYADAVMMSLWPSRGLTLEGVEIKVTRADWKREAADPSKAETIAAYCDKWWIHTGPNVIDDVSDVPGAWGWRVYDGKRWKTMREAEKTQAKPMDRTFLAALLRRADDVQRRLVQDATQAARASEMAEAERRRKSMQERIKSEVARRTAELERNAESVREFKSIFGDRSLSDWMIDTRKLAAAARIVHDVSKSFSGDLPQRLRAAADALEEIMPPPVDG
jgi:hypothetical protein